MLYKLNIYARAELFMLATDVCFSFINTVKHIVLSIKLLFVETTHYLTNGNFKCLKRKFEKHFLNKSEGFVSPLLYLRISPIIVFYSFEYLFNYYKNTHISYG